MMSKTLSENIALQRILELKMNKGISDLEFEKELGLSKRTVSNWRRSLSESYLKMLPQLSSYFNVSVDYLLGGSVTFQHSGLNSDNDRIDAAQILKKEPASFEKLAHDIEKILIEKGIIIEGVPLSEKEYQYILSGFDIATDALLKVGNQ